jgi:hypothetical protein
MAGLALLGAVMGVLFAYLATGRTRNFRKKLLAELELHSRNGTASDYVTGIINFRAQWTKSLSLIRKPFSRQINLAVETAALILSILGLVTGISNFDRTFNGLLEGAAVLTFLGIVMTYVPSEWFFSGKIEADMDVVIEELRAAAAQGRMEAYITEAEKSWR